MQLVIGNKNYSSWSMRPWVLMRQLGIHFEEVKLRLDFDPHSLFKRTLAHHSPAGKVPVLVDDHFAVWDTMAINEYLHDKFPGRGVWPEDIQQRARARSIAAEMHAGFTALRTHCPMNIEADLCEVGERVWDEQPEVRADMARIEIMWAEALLASGGPFLFGAFCAADAMYAPVCMRLRTYGLPMPATTRTYIDHVAAAPGVAAWIADALVEHDFLAFDEPYRRHR
ncbi:MAG: glutathione S-transferase family protein [Burkholderiales bacterium]|nr:glutathione S-transferase family protein [Burkholderiales bacterium]MDE1929348.1 glutathione S-transferase family protein [Burkholderiales bacterium]MDE2505468.1 glutathione S-transferase family protein [Burkholderiales bacterium]